MRFFGADGKSNSMDFPDTENVANQIPYENIKIEKCYIEGYFQPIHWSDSGVDGGTTIRSFSVIDCTFMECVDDHMHMKAKTCIGNYVFTGNIIIRAIGKLFVIHNTGDGANITVENNKMINPISYSWSNYDTTTGKAKS